MNGSIRISHGEQEGAAYSDHFSGGRYYTLFIFQLVRRPKAARSGNDHKADDWRSLLVSVV